METSDTLRRTSDRLGRVALDEGRRKRLVEEIAESLARKEAFDRTFQTRRSFIADSLMYCGFLMGVVVGGTGVGGLVLIVIATTT